VRTLAEIVSEDNFTLRAVAAGCIVFVRDFFSLWRRQLINRCTHCDEIFPQHVSWRQNEPYWSSKVNSFFS